MIDEVTKEVLAHIKPLTPDVLHTTRNEALFDVQNKIGERPQMKDHKFDWSWRQELSPLDFLFLIFFVALMTISLIHQLTFSGELALATYSEMPDAFQKFYDNGYRFPLWMDQAVYVSAIQIGGFLLAESGTLAFSIWNYFQIRRWEQRNRKEMGWFFKWVNFRMIAAFVCAIVALTANLHAMSSAKDGLFKTFGIFIGVVVPVLTIFIGEYYSAIISRFITGREASKLEFRERMREWDRFSREPMTHPLFETLWKERIVNWYRVNGPKSKSWPSFEWNNFIEMVLAAREMARSQQAEGLGDLISFFAISPKGESVSVTNPSSESLPPPSQQPQAESENSLRPLNPFHTNTNPPPLSLSETSSDSG